MKEEILKKIYAKPEYLDYLRKHPKWYYYLDENEKNYAIFEKTVLKTLKKTTYDKLETVKNQVSFISALMKYLGK